MWLLFGLATLVGSCLLIWWQRRDDRWQGTPWQQRLRFQEWRNSKSKRLMRLRVGIAIDPALDFELKRETWFDRLGKALGLSEEAQLGRPGFDESCYLISDDMSVRGRLRREARFTEGLRGLAEFDHEFRFRRLVCRNGMLRIDLKPVDNPASVYPTLDQLGRMLEQVVDDLPSSTSRVATRDPYFWRALLLLAASGGLALSGAINLFRMLIVKFPFTVDLSQLWAVTLPVAAMLLFLMVVATAVLLSRTSRAHLVLREVLLVGGFGALATAYVEVHDFNISADFSQAEARQATVLSCDIHRGRKGSKSYSLQVSNWNPDGGERSIKVSVSHGQFTQFQVGAPIVLYQHPGRLGIRWVERISPP